MEKVELSTIRKPQQRPFVGILIDEEIQSYKDTGK